MLEHTATFKDAFLIFLALEQLSMSALYDIREVWFEFHHFPCTVDDIHTIVIVEEEGAVVKMPHSGDDGPWTFCFFCRKDVGVAHAPLFIGCQQGIESALVVF